MNSLNTPVTKGSVVALVIERIKEALIHHELKPGDCLPSEAELARNLAVGKSSVREAIKMLQAMGVLEIRRGQGTYIRTSPGSAIVNPLIFQMIMEERQNDHIIEIRKIFEPVFTVLAMKRAASEDLEAIRATVAALEASIAQGTQKAEDDMAFHLAILRATHNPYIIRIGETVLQLFKASIRTSMRTIPEVALRDHRRILEAFESGDENRLNQAVLESFEGWKQSLAWGPRADGP